MWLRYPRKFLVVSEEPRVAMAGVIDSPLGVLTIATTHLSFVPGWNVHQLRRLRRDLTPLPDPLVLLGDLNLTCRSAARVTGYRPLTDVATFPTDAPTRQLDHALLRGRLGPVRYQSSRQLPLSDHRALIIDL